MLTEVIKPIPDSKDIGNPHPFTGIDLTVGLGKIIEQNFAPEEATKLFSDDLNRMGELTLSDPNSEKIGQIAQQVRSKLSKHGLEITDSDISEAIVKANQEEFYLDQKEQERRTKLSPNQRRQENKQIKKFRKRMLRKLSKKTRMTKQEILIGLREIRNSFYNPHS